MDLTTMKKTVISPKITGWFFNRPAWSGVIAFLLVLFLTSTLIFLRYQILKAEARHRAEEALFFASNQLEQVLEKTFTATLALSFIIDKDGHPQNFDSVAASLIETNTHIDALELVPNGVITYVYPLKGNESVLGYNILTDPERSEEALRAKLEKRLYFAGPMNLRQGGVGVVGRIPIFHGGKFWGFSAAVISFNKLLASAGIDSTGASGFYFQLCKMNASLGKEECFLPVRNTAPGTVTAKVVVSEGEWILSVAPIESSFYPGLVPLMVLGFFLPIFVGLLTYYVTKRPMELQELVDIRTSELVSNRENLHQIMASMADDYYVIDKSYKVTLINESAHENLFKTWGVYIYPGTYIIDVLPKDRALEIKKNFDRVFAGERIEYEVEVDLDGEHHWRVVNYSPVYDESGKIKGANIITRDISDRRLAAEALRQSELKYRTLIEQASDAIVVYDQNGRMLEFNQSALRYTGYLKEEVANLRITDFLFAEELQQTPLRFEELRSGASVTDQRRIRRKDGSGFIAELHSKILPDGHIMAIARDITEKKNAELALRRSEERYRSLIEQASDGIVICERDGRILQVNKSMVSLTGYAEDILLNFSFGQLIDGHSASNSPFPQNLHTDHSHVFERKLVRKNGSTVDIEINAKLTSFHTVIGFIRDISIRKRAEEEIINSELRFRTLTVNAPVGIFQCDVEGRTIYVNESFLQTTGMASDDLMNLGWEKVVHSADRERVVNNWFKQQSESIEEFRVVRPGGELAWITGKVVPLFNKNGDLAGYIGTISDITDRIKAEEKIKDSRMKLAESEARLKAIIEQAPDAVYLCDPEEGRIVESNPVATLQLGFTTAELYNRRVTDLDAEFTSWEKLSAFWKSLKPNQPVRLETNHRRKDGSVFPVEIKTSLIRIGDRNYIIGFVRDVTERKKAEQEILLAKERYEQIAVATNDALWEQDMITNSTWWNLKHYQYYGHNPELPPLDLKEWEHRIHPDQREGIIRDFDLAIERKLSYWEREYKFRISDGGYKYVNDRVFFYYRDGQLVKILGSMSDVTERKVSEERLRESEERHRLMSEQLRDLTGHLQNVREEERMHVAREIHDELGQQLTVLKMDVSWLHKRLNAEDEVVREKLQNLLKLIDTTVKTVRKISSELRPSMLDDLGLVAALEWHSQEFQQKVGIQINFRSDWQDIKLPSKVSNGLFRIYQESLTNIARHAQASEVNVVLRDDRGNMELTISDNGKGFVTSTVENKKTLGILGMRERAKMLGGGFEIASTRGKGTSIRIVVPVHGMVHASHKTQG